MARSKKTERDHQVNRYVGAKVATFRAAKKWTLAELSEQLDMSTAHLKSLESGRYSFSATLLCRLSEVFECPVEAFIPRPSWERTKDVEKQWNAVCSALPPRERRTLLQLGRRLARMPTNKWWFEGQRLGTFISLEGIDGVVLRRQADRLRVRLRRQVKRRRQVALSQYDFSTELWQFMISRFRDPTGSKFRALERTLLFACERLYRQENEILKVLHDDGVVVSTFFFMAAEVYQRMEGLEDVTVVDSVNEFLQTPDLVIHIESDPEVAARRALRNPETTTDDQGHPTYEIPNGRFYSPYRKVDDFEHAHKEYQGLVKRIREEQKDGLGPKCTIISVEERGTAEELADELFERVNAELDLSGS